MKELFSLNARQKEAVETLEGPVLVLAGAGSGKTRVVSYRIVNLIENGIPPSKILGLTFTNKAAGEMNERIEALCHHKVLISTFHSLGLKILKESIHHLDYLGRFNIYDEEDIDKLIKVCLEELGLKEKKLDIKWIKGALSKAKNNLKGPECFEDASFYESEMEEYFPRIYALYQKKLKEFQAVDFDDLLFLPIKLWQEHPEILQKYQERWPFILIDEYQDTNEAQYTLLKMLVEKSQNIFAVGDPDQSIYSWRGANIQNILHFDRDYPNAKIILLEQNYRSRTTILNAANALINHNDHRGSYRKSLWSELGEGEKIRLFAAEDDREEANFVASSASRHEKLGTRLSEMAVFYRTNAQSRIFEDYLLAHGIPYKIIGGLSFYQRREIKDILAFLKLIESENDYIAFARTIHLPKRGFGEATIEKIRQNASLEGKPIIEYCRLLLNGTEKEIRLNARQKEGLKDYLRIIDHLRELSKEGTIEKIVTAAIEETGYKEYLKEDKETYQDRRENIDQLVTKAIQWEMAASLPTLSHFLDELTLKSNIEEEDVKERLNLMTIHHGKGLEFTVAFLVGMEELLFPHVNAKDSEEAIQEERRLCYVGITRAKELLYITYSRYRLIWGSLRSQRASRFLREIPFEYMEKVGYAGALSSPSLYESQKPVEASFSSGDEIIHREFGRGEIQEVYEGALGLTYKIYFDADKKVKTIVAKYATLVPSPN